MLPWLSISVPVAAYAAAIIGVVGLLAVAPRVSTRPFADRKSLRGIAVATVISAHLFGLLAFAGGFVHWANVVVAPAACLLSFAVGLMCISPRNEAEKAPFRTDALPWSLSLITSVALILAARRFGASMEAGVGPAESLGLVVPGLAMVVLPVILAPVQRRGGLSPGTLFGVVTIATIAAAAAGGIGGAGAPLRPEDPLEARFGLSLTLVTLPVAVMAALVVCVVVTSPATTLRAIFCGPAASLGAALHLLAESRTDLLVPVCGPLLAAGAVTAAATVRPGLPKWSGVAALLVSVATGVALAPQHVPLLGVCTALLGLVTWIASADGGIETPLGTVEPSATGLVLCASTVCVLSGLVSIRPTLSFQAASAASQFRYDRYVKVDRDMRRMLREGNHAISLEGGRFAWVLPQSIMWTKDGAWHDSLIPVTAVSREKWERIAPPTLLRAGVSDVRGAISIDAFMDAHHVKVSLPVRQGEDPVEVVTATARHLSQGQVLQWLGVWPASISTTAWAAAGTIVGFGLARMTRLSHIIPVASVSAVALVGVLSGAGAGGVVAVVLTLTALACARSTRPDGADERIGLAGPAAWLALAPLFLLLRAL